MWCKLKLKSFTLPSASLGRILNHSCLVSKCTVCLLKHWVATQHCFPYCRHTQGVLFQLNFFYSYIQAARGRKTACWFWGKRGSAERTLLLNCFLSPWMTCGGTQFLAQGISLRTAKQWPSLRQDQGITLNPPDRCHMHARAHKYTEKQKWWRGRERRRERGSESGRCEFEKKKKTHIHTRKAQCAACIVTLALVCRMHIWCSVMQGFQLCTWDTFHLIAS